MNRRNRDEMPGAGERWTLGDLRCHWEALLGEDAATYVTASRVWAGGVLEVRAPTSWAVDARSAHAERELLRRLPRVVEGVTLKRISWNGAVPSREAAA